MALNTESLNTEPLDHVPTAKAAEDWELNYVVIPASGGGWATKSVAVFEDGSYTEWLPADALEL